ncbi:MAG: SoxR reducing system RseC family protein [Bacteroidetes bacterium]|nr:SoxR reducing system RseC family protein [Bacteroidota bacterium]
MNPQTEIEHTGVVCDTTGGKIRVKITPHSSCASCSAAGLCSASESPDKFFELRTDQTFQQGQQVKVVTSLSNGFLALAMGYVLPLVILVVVLICMLSAGFSELISGTGSVTAVALYYLAIYLMRDKIARKIEFTLKPA